VVDLTEGLGEGTVPVFKLFKVAEAGSFGGGILSYFIGWDAYSESRSFAAWEILVLFEVPRFHPRLSFLLNEDPEEGVEGSSGLEI
jgi:hypothetical protein